MTSDPSSAPASVSSPEWTGDPKARKADFASDCPGAPMLSRGLVDRVGQEQLERAGRLVDA
jgi:hypothetical protein